MYEFHGIKWLNDDELDADSPERRGPGWAHAYVPVVGPEGGATGTAHVPIYMPRIYKELKRFALQIYKAAGGSTDVELSGWWADIKKGFKKMAKVVAKNKVLRAVAEKGLQSAVPGGTSLSEGAAKVAEELVAKYRGGQQEAAGQIKGFMEQANKGDEGAAKIVDALRREYVKQQAAGLPALMQTMSSGDVVVYDPIVGAKRRMTKQQQRKVNQARKRQAAQQRRQQPGPKGRTSPLRNSPNGPVTPGTRAQQLRQGVQPGLLTPAALRPGLLQPNVYPGAQYPGYPNGYPQYPQYPGGDYGPASYGPQDGGESYYDPQQDADDEADLQAAAEENLARMYPQEDLEAAEDETAMAGAYYDVGYKPSEAERAIYAKLTPEERAQLKKMGKKEGKAFLQQRAVQKRQATRQRDFEQRQRRAEKQKEDRRKQGAQIRREREVTAKRHRDRAAERKGYEQQLEELRHELERRDIADDKRAALEAQADEYEQLVAKAEQDTAALERRMVELQHQQELVEARRGAPMPPAAPAPALYDEERSEEYDTNDPLVLETLAHMQAAAEVEQDEE